MNIPGFTAEASLYKVGKQYQQVGGGIYSTASVVPAGSCCAPCGKDLCCDECPPTGSDDGKPRFQVFQFRMLM